ARLWEVALGNPLGGPLTRAGSVVAVAISPDGRRVATPGRDRVARLWDALTGEPVGEALPHDGEGNAGLFSPDSQTLVSGGGDTFALFWLAATGQPLVREGLNKFKLHFGISARSKFGREVGRLFGGGKSLNKFQDDGQRFWGPGRAKPSSLRGGVDAPVFAL